VGVRKEIDMLKIFYLKGAPACGKSTWAKTEIAKDPLNYLRVNNDDIRSMANSSVFSADYEKLIRETRLFLIKQGIQRGLNIIVDNVNSSKRNWEDVCKIAKESNKDVQVIEKNFYVELDELLERNSKREGVARVPDDVVKKFWKELGGKQFAHYPSKVEIFTKRSWAADKIVEPMAQDEGLPRAIICDLDGTLAKIGDRSPYDASLCDITDVGNEHVVQTVKLHYDVGYKIIFCSGRMNKDRDPTVRFIDKCLPNMEYVLLMRRDNDQRRDALVKEEIFNENIRGKYWVKLVIDDRISVCRLWHGMGLNLLRVGDPDADF
jgi:predicted kinase